MIDLKPFIPYLLAALALAIAAGWFIAHDRAVATKAVATDRAAANEVVIAAQQKSLDDKQKVIDYADVLSKERAAQLAALQAGNAQYRSALAALAADPDVARVLATRLPEPVRELRRAAAAPGGGDRVPVLHAPGMADRNADATVSGRDIGGAAGRKPDDAGRAGGLQPGQIEDQKTGRRAASTGLRWPAGWNPLNWFEPSRSTP